MIIVTAYYIVVNGNQHGSRIAYNAKVEKLTELREYLSKINNCKQIDFEFKIKNYENIK